MALSDRRGTIAARTIAGVIVLAVVVYGLERREKGTLATIHPGAPQNGRATSTSPRGRPTTAGQAPTTASEIASKFRPPPTPQPTLTSASGGEAAPEVPFDSAPDEGSGDICEEDIAAVFELCDPTSSRSDCAGVLGEEGEACQAGCVMQTCPKLRDCAKPDPPWCGASCDNARGGLFWRNFWSAYYACKWQFDSTQPALGDCTTSHVEEMCPELAGTGWAARFRGI
jgi:hypothetical protein